ncbi:50S ribosomal protein L29 [Nitrosomonas halophila]|uniref:Large ribosomal subunit protein uL29 n=1 Tax=Nitrosomonas halophila TaxID=44576 RepID=A0A1H3N271_9PROT|nr:50S ribosomal protein L29 [Nitrosomonas halophila]SDY82843.1 large subunit ribosomal protein L29 [Nitrosomonas halophila]
MKTEELRNKDRAELEKELLSLRRTQFGLRMRQATQQLENVSQIKNVRRDIARVKTILGQKAAQS